MEGFSQDYYDPEPPEVWHTRGLQQFMKRFKVVSPDILKPMVDGVIVPEKEDGTTDQAA